MILQDNTDVLLTSLLKKLEGKPVYKTLVRIADGKTESSWEELKGLHSLCTHICIEIERGTHDYVPLLCSTQGAIRKVTQILLGENR